LLVAALACTDDGQSPTDPAPSLAVASLTFRQVSGGDEINCGVTTDAA
jgi:hypothetical protein